MVIIKDNVIEEFNYVRFIIRMSEMIDINSIYITIRIVYIYINIFSILKYKLFHVSNGLLFRNEFQYFAMKENIYLNR